LLLGGTFLAAPVLSLRLRLTGFLEALLLRWLPYPVSMIG
jgi:hypothetical protein